jgi:hypothetical protein
MSNFIRVRYPKRWDKKHPTAFYEGEAEVLPNGDLKCRWEGVSGFFICSPKTVIIVSHESAGTSTTNPDA